MIDGRVLYKAAEEANRAIIDSLPLEDECNHCFSDSFEYKMKRVIYREKHSNSYQLIKRIASVLLVLFIGASLVFSFSSEARSSFSNWVKKIYEEYVIYKSGESDSNSFENNDYIVNNLPDGYTEVRRIELSSGGMVMYENAKGDFINLSYDYPQDSQIAIMGTDYEIIKTTVGRYSADFYLFADSQEGNSIIWIDEERNILFQIDARFDEEEIVILAESVMEDRKYN